MNTKVNFVVISTQRSGSTWLIDLFKNCKDTEGHDELFYNSPRKTKAQSGFNEYKRYCETHRERTYKFRPISVWHYLANLYRRAGSVGFKLQYSHIKRFPEILLFLRVKNIKVIHLVRKNSLDLVISQAIATQTGISHTKHENTIAELSFKLDITDCVSRINKLEKKKSSMSKMLRVLFPGHLEIYYEDLLTSIESFERVITFLKLEKTPGALKSSLKKRQTSSKRDLISNFDELEVALKEINLQYLL